MAHLFITLAHDPTVRPAFNELTRHLGAAAINLYAAFLDDSVALAGRAAGSRVSIVAQAGSHLADHLQVPADRMLLLPDLRPASVASAIADALAAGPVVLFGGDMPHLPIWRLRDALTHLDGGADVVIGPAERGGWYLIGLRAAHPALLRALPDSDAPPDDLCIAAATHGLRVMQIPAWYTLGALSDVDRLAADLRTMPPDVAAQTRTLLHGDSARSRAVGE